MLRCVNIVMKWWKKVALYCQVGLVHNVEVMLWRFCVEIIPVVNNWLDR